MAETTANESGSAARRPKDRSPSFPFIPLQTATERLIAFEKHFGRHPTPADKAGVAWGMKAKSSQADQTLAALRSFGLVRYDGMGVDRQIVLTEEGRTYLRAQQESVKQQILKQCALRPKIIRKFWTTWGADRPIEAVALDELILKNGFSDAGADNFLRVYDATVAYAGLTNSDTVVFEKDDPRKDAEEEGRKPVGSSTGHQEKLPPPPSVRVGDYVQWSPGGVDQFKQPQKVVGIWGDGLHVQVFGSMREVPMSEVAVVDPPVAPPTGVMQAIRIESASAGTIGDNEFNVLQRGGRLQITADVDLEGLQQLKEMLVDYESILKRLKK
jgi:hypothetical protein